MTQQGTSVAVGGVLFDYGQVLTGPPEPCAWRRMQELLAMEGETFAARYWEHRPEYDRGGLNGRAYWDAVAGTALPEEQRHALFAADTALWTEVNTPMMEWALRLRAAGTPTGILSNLGDAMMHGVLGTLSWMHGFPTLVFSHHLGIIKPDAAIYAHAAREMGLAPERILFVDDKEENVAGALAAGLQAVRYADHVAFVAELERRGLGELWRSGTVPG